MDAFRHSLMTSLAFAALVGPGTLLSAADEGAVKLPTWFEPEDLPAVREAGFSAAPKPKVQPDFGRMLTREVEPKAPPAPPAEFRPLPREPLPLVTTAERTVRQIEYAAAEAKSEHALGRLIRRCDEALRTLGDDDETTRSRRARVEAVASWAHESRGRLRSASDRHGPAADDFRAAVRLSPANHTARHALAVSLAEDGLVDLAIAEFTRVIEARPKSYEARRNRASVYLERGSAEAAVADCDVALAGLPPGHAERVETLRLRGAALHAAGRLREAATDYNEAIRLDPRHAATYAARANVFAEGGFYEQALTDYKAALEADARHAEAYRSLAWMLATCPETDLRDPQTAVEAAWRARRLLGEDDFLTLEASAAAFAATGDFDEAVRLQQRAVLAAGDDSASESRARLNRYRAGEPYTAP